MNYFITKDVFLKNNTPSRTLWVRFNIFFLFDSKAHKAKTDSKGDRITVI